LTMQSGCAGIREKAALTNAAYGKKTGSDRIARQTPRAGHRSGPRRTSRGPPLRPPTIAYPRRPRTADCARNSTTVTINSGSDAAAASSGLGGYWNRLQIFVVIV